MRRIVRLGLWTMSVPVIAAALVGAAWAAFTPISVQSRESVHVIPAGTFARRMAGEPIDLLPSEIHLTLGIQDVLVLKNRDDVPQMFALVLIMPGQSFRLPFGVASRYQFACSAHLSGQLTVVVEPAPMPGWPRLKWRARAMLNSEARS